MCRRGRIRTRFHPRLFPSRLSPARLFCTRWHYPRLFDARLVLHAELALLELLCAMELRSVRRRRHAAVLPPVGLRHVAIRRRRIELPRLRRPRLCRFTNDILRLDPCAAGRR